MTTTETTELVDRYQDTIDAYFMCWNEPTADGRQAAVERTWAEGARSVDPMADVTGHTELGAMFAHFHETYAGHSFAQRGALDTHHGLVRWGWSMLDEAGNCVLEGIDVARVDDAGRITSLAGFFGADVPVKE